jgi:hypothetical protein
VYCGLQIVGKLGSTKAAGAKRRKVPHRHRRQHPAGPQAFEMMELRSPQQSRLSLDRSEALLHMDRTDSEDGGPMHLFKMPCEMTMKRWQ